MNIIEEMMDEIKQRGSNVYQTVPVPSYEQPKSRSKLGHAALYLGAVASLINGVVSAAEDPRQLLKDRLEHRIYVENDQSRDRFKIEIDYRLEDGQIADVNVTDKQNALHGKKGHSKEAWDIKNSSTNDTFGHRIYNKTLRYGTRLAQVFTYPSAGINYKEKPKEFKGSDLEWYYYFAVDNEWPLIDGKKPIYGKVPKTVYSTPTAPTDEGEVTINDVIVILNGMGEVESHSLGAKMFDVVTTKHRVEEHRRMMSTAVLTKGFSFGQYYRPYYCRPIVAFGFNFQAFSSSYGRGFEREIEKIDELFAGRLDIGVYLKNGNNIGFEWTGNEVGEFRQLVSHVAGNENLEYHIVDGRTLTKSNVRNKVGAAVNKGGFKPSRVKRDRR